MHSTKLCKGRCQFAIRKLQAWSQNLPRYLENKSLDEPDCPHASPSSHLFNRTSQ